MKSKKNKKPPPDDKKKRELQKDHTATGKQRQSRLAKVPCRQHSLHHPLVRAMRGHRQKRSPQNPRPERVALRQIERDMEQVELARSRSDRMDLRPSARN